tara:strand:- start:78206 stop:78907 length:702 start_codon:yes stop_codon:yes gene_type:complete
MKRLCKVTIPLVLTLGLATNAAATVQIPVYDGPADTGWQSITIPGVNQTAFTKGEDGSLVADSMAGFGMIVRELKRVEDYPVLEWRWRVDQRLPATDASVKGGDDRPIALHVWFPLKEDESSVWSSIGDALSDLIGLPPGGRVITCMWGGKHKAGSSFPNPHLPERGMIVIKRGDKAPAAEWVTERINIRADYQRLFGTSAPSPSHITISADTDDTGLKSRAAIVDIRFMAEH